MHPIVTELFDVEKRRQIQQRTPEWYERRKTLITASDAAAALGIKPYASYPGDPRFDALKKKIGGDRFRGNMFTAHGVRYEDEARRLISEALGDVIFDVGLFVHADLDWLGASPDGITASGMAVEIKCPMMRKPRPGHVPEHYWPQIQVAMEVTGLSSCLWVEYVPSELDSSTHRRHLLTAHVVERDRAWFARHRDALQSFHRECTQGIERRRMSDTARSPLEPESAAAAAASAAAASTIPCEIVDDIYDNL